MHFDKVYPGCICPFCLPHHPEAIDGLAEKIPDLSEHAKRMDEVFERAVSALLNEVSRE
jgi:hypothetical protein